MENFTYPMMCKVEKVGEMLGVIVFIRGLVLYMTVYIEEVRV